MSICLSFCLNPFIYQFVYLSQMRYLLKYPSIYQSQNISVYLAICKSNMPSSIDLSIYVSLYRASTSSVMGRRRWLDHPSGCTVSPGRTLDSIPVMEITNGIMWPMILFTWRSVIFFRFPIQGNSTSIVYYQVWLFITIVHKVLQ